MKRLTRAEVPVDQTWDLSDIYPSLDTWNADFAHLDTLAAAVTRHQGKLGESAATLLACLDARDALLARLQRFYFYASFLNAGDGTNPEYQSHLARARAVYAKLQAAVTFVDTEILTLPDGCIERFRAEEPGLATHKTDLDDLLEVKPHMLGAEAEKVLAALSDVTDTPYLVYQRSKSNDMQFEPFKDAAGKEYPNSFNLYESTYESHEDTSVRRGAWASFCEGLKRYNHTYSATFAAEISKNVVMAQLRGYANAEEALLQPHKTTFQLYTNVVEMIQAELAPHMQRYARLRKRVLGLDKLLYCDIKAPLDPDFSPSTTFEEAGAMILEAVAPMGEEYTTLIRDALQRRWVDRADNIGKSSGAFCGTPYGVHPYVLITWTDSMRDAFVLAHELGHAGHFGLASRYQRYVNTRPAMPFVEAPSIMNETLLARLVLDRGSDARTRRWVIMQTLGTYHHNFVTHMLEAELQRQVYARAGKGEPVTAQLLNERKGAILKKFWGDTVEIDEGASMTWMRQPHYYLGLYPYTYSVGLVAATALSEKYRQEGPQVLQKWLAVLKAGGNMRPLELMKAAGIDLTTPEPIASAVRYVGSLVEELERSFDAA